MLVPKKKQRQGRPNKHAWNGGSVPKTTQSAAPVANPTLQAYTTELEADINALKDAVIELRSERERVLLAMSEIIKDTSRFTYFVKEELGSLDLKPETPLGPLAGRLKFLLEAVPRSLSAAGVAAPDLIGVDYVPGLNVEAINLESFGSDEELVIVDVVEPLLTYTPKNVDSSDEGQRFLLRVGKVLVARKGIA